MINNAHLIFQNSFQFSNLDILLIFFIVTVQIIHCPTFDLGGKILENAPRSASLYLRHYRYYYDPPEFQTVITTTDTTADSKLMHLGYFR